MITINKASCLDAPIKVDALNGVAFTKEQGAHKFIVSCYQNGEKLNLTGTITGKFTCNGRTIEIALDYAGIDEDGNAWVVLSQHCYDYAGRFQLAIFNTVGDTTFCIYACVGNVQISQIGDLVDGGEIIDSVETLIQEIQTAVQSIPPTYTELVSRVDNLESALNKKIELGTSSTLYLADGTNVDDLATGTYIVPNSTRAQTITGNPPTKAIGYKLIVMGINTSTKKIQIAVTASTGSPTIKYRWYTNNAWTDWVDAASISQVETLIENAVGEITDNITEIVQSINEDIDNVNQLINSNKSYTDASDESIENRLSYVNYGYDTQFHREINPDGTLLTHMGIDRVNTIITLNKTKTFDTTLFIKINGSVEIGAGTNGLKSWDTNGVSLTAGHRYCVRVKHLSGQYVMSDGSELVCNPYRVGTSVTPNAVITIAFTDECGIGSTFIAEENVEYNFALVIRGGATTFTNAKFLVTLEDVTNAIIDTVNQYRNLFNIKPINNGETVIIDDWKQGSVNSDGIRISSTTRLYSPTLLVFNTANNLHCIVPTGFEINFRKYKGIKYVESTGYRGGDFLISESHDYYYEIYIRKANGDPIDVADIPSGLSFIGVFAENTSKLPKTGTFEYFSVSVSRPLNFGEDGENVITTDENVECILALPDTYSQTGTPTRLILWSHGNGGFVSERGVYSPGDGVVHWKSVGGGVPSTPLWFVQQGYAVFDANYLPSDNLDENATLDDWEDVGRHYGSALYVNVLKHAYDYIQKNYNVEKEIFVYGFSMGGATPYTFSKSYPQIVLAGICNDGNDYAGRFAELANAIENGTTSAFFSSNKLIPSWGYSSVQELLDDKFSRVLGMFQLLSLKRYDSNGVLIVPPNRETDFVGWLRYYGNLMDTDVANQYLTAVCNVPIMSWRSTQSYPNGCERMANERKAFINGGSAPHELVIYTDLTHIEMSRALEHNMREQFLAWIKRWE